MLRDDRSDPHTPGARVPRVQGRYFAVIDLPKNPKAEDLLPVLADLDRRLAALEATSKDDRIAALQRETSKLRWKIEQQRR